MTRHLSREINHIDRSLRIALYSHDTCGLGHMRRNLLIAETLVDHFPNVNVLLITGAREVAAFRFPDRVDAVSLPSLYKKANEKYSARSFELDISELIRMRSNIIRTSLASFDADVFIVDKVPRGTMGELDATLAFLAAQTSTKCVLGLRDILDNPEVTTSEWTASENTAAVERWYDAVWVYGDEAVFDYHAAYGFSREIEEKLTYVGYLDPSVKLAKARPGKGEMNLLNELGERFYLCAVGGGQDGIDLAEAFVLASFPAGVKGLLVTGPHMGADARQRLQQIVDSKPHLVAVDFLSEPLHVYRAAERIVSMGGYNTTMELLGIGATALVVPRIRPREEQWMRSRLLHELGLLDHLQPADLSPEAISAWFRKGRDPRPAGEVIDMNGLKRIPHLLEGLIPGFAASKNETQTSNLLHAFS